MFACWFTAPPQSAFSDWSSRKTYVSCGGARRSGRGDFRAGAPGDDGRAPAWRTAADEPRATSTSPLFGRSIQRPDQVEQSPQSPQEFQSHPFPLSERIGVSAGQRPFPSTSNYDQLRGVRARPTGQPIRSTPSDLRRSVQPGSTVRVPSAEIDRPASAPWIVECGIPSRMTLAAHRGGRPRSGLSMRRVFGRRLTCRLLVWDEIKPNEPSVAVGLPGGSPPGARRMGRARAIGPTADARRTVRLTAAAPGS
jgi:hypothetical protein